MKTVVIHSNSKPAWNIINKKLGAKRKIAIVPYVEGIESEKQTAFEHAVLISKAFNNSELWI